MLFHDVTIVVGSTFSRRKHDSAGLKPAAVEVFRDLLERHGAAFRAPLPVRGLKHIELQWTQEGTAALATFWSHGEPITMSAIVPGLVAEDDRQVLAMLQQLVMELHGNSPLEPAFDVLKIADRPLLATLLIPRPFPHRDTAVIADAETCLAAAFLLSTEGR